MAVIQTSRPEFRERLLQALGILGFVAILILGAWGIFRIVTSLPGILGNLTASVGGSRDEEEKLSVTSPTGSLSSEASSVVAWSHTGGEGNYGYAVSYDCHDKLSVSSQLPNGSYQPVPCNTPFNFTNSQTSVPVKISYTGASDIGLTFTVAATKLETGAVTASGTRSVTIMKKAEEPAPAPTTGSSGSGSTPKPATKPSSSTTYVNTGRVSNPNGVSDLAVTVLSTGVIDASGYRPNTPVRIGQRAGVQFQVINLGDKTVPTGWSFNATLPLPTPFLYNAPAQAELTPGSAVVYTLGFEGFGGTNFTCYRNPSYPYNEVCPQNSNCYYPQGGTYPYACPVQQPYPGSLAITIVADPQGFIPDPNRFNNTASAQFNTVVY